MKHKINEDRCFKTTYKKETEEFTIYGVKSLNPSKKFIFFIPGLNGNGTMINYWNYPFANEWNLFSFDARAQGDNTCRPSRNYKTYIKDIHNIIEFIKKEYQMEEVILLGESWGGALCSLYAKYYNDVNGYFFWNVPYHIVDVSNEKGKSKFIKSAKMILTFLTNINTYDNGRFVDKLTNDEVLIRVVKALRRNRVSNRVIIAAWLSFKKSWKFIAKNFERINFKYVQSLQDILGSIDVVNNLKNKTDKIIIFDKGFHILSFDKEMDEKLFNEVYNFLGNKI